MEIKLFRLHNVGRFKHIEVPLAPTQNNPCNVTIFVGNNGAGKTSLLKSLATSLSWFVSRVRSEKGSGSPISEEAIHNSALSAAVDIEVFDELGQQDNSDADIANHLFHWTIAKPRRGRKGNHVSQLTEATKLADRYRQALSNQENTNLPLIAFYPVERVVLDIPLKIKDRHSFLQLDGYDNSLNTGVDFRRFFEWFREREDSENETGISQEILERLQKILFGSDDDVWRRLNELKASSRDRQLTAVRTAITNFMPGFTNLKVRRKPLHMSIDKNNEPFNVLQLSQGEKSLMALVGDIARRLAMMNPALENPLQGDGIVLIDEVDMHLHPKWQRSLIERLTSTFPNCQFVLSTHSPLVISDCKNILIYALDDGELTALSSQYGQDANTVLLDVMDTHIRNSVIAERLNNLLDWIQDSQLEKAKEEIENLEADLPANNLELIKARMLFLKQELKHAKNN